MRKALVIAVVSVACAERTPAPTTVAIALPLPPPTATVARVERPDVAPAIDDGDFSSERGMVHLTAHPDGTVSGSFPGGVVTCKTKGAELACRWYLSSSEGGATLRRKADGRLEGTWGNGGSGDDGGSWTLVPVARASPLEGVWDTNWGVATLRAIPRGVHVDYPQGSMECEQHRETLVCTWTEGSATGNAELTIESSHVLRGQWGSGSSSRDGGGWVFVKRP